MSRFAKYLQTAGTTASRFSPYLEEEEPDTSRFSKYVEEPQQEPDSRFSKYVDPRKRDWRDEGFKWMRPDTPAGRIFDVLSRSNYGMANWSLEQVKAARGEAPEWLDPEAQRKFMTIPAPIRTHARGQIAALRGLFGKDKVFFEDVLNEADATKNLPTGVKTALGLVGDIGLDPLTYLSGGLTKAGKGAKVAAGAARAGKLTDTGIELAEGAGKLAKFRHARAGKALGKAVKITGKSPEELAGLWTTGTKAQQAQGGLRGMLNLGGHQLVAGQPYYRWGERFPSYLAGVMPDVMKSKPQAWVDENIPILRTAANEAKRAFTPGDTNVPWLRNLNIKGKRRGITEAARLESIFDSIVPDVAKAARESSDPDYLAKLFGALETPLGSPQSANYQKLKALERALGMPDVVPGAMRDLLAQRQTVLDDIAGAMTRAGVDAKMADFAAPLRQFFDEAADIEEKIYKKYGLAYKRFGQEGMDYMPHVSTPKGVDELGRRPELAELVQDMALHDPSQRYRQWRIPARDINEIVTGQRAGQDMGTIFGPRYKGLTMKNALVEENPLIAAKIRAGRMKRIVTGDEFVTSLKKSGHIRKAADIEVRPALPERPGPARPWTAGTHRPQLPAQIPAGWRVPEITGSAWGVEKNLLDGWYAPSQVASEVERVWQMAHDPRTQKSMLKLYKQALNTWRGYALLAPSYHARNLLSNVWQNFVAGVSDPIAYKKSLEFQLAMKRMAKDGGASLDAFRLAVPWGEMTGPELRKLLFDEDLLGGFMSEWAKEVDIINQATTQASRWLTPHRKAMHYNLAAGTNIENNARFALFFDQMGKGYDPMESANTVRKFLFDYSETGLSKFEANTLRPLTGFYRWTKNNMLLSVEQLAKQPGKYAGIAKVKHGIEELTAEGSPSEEFMPEWLAEGYAVRVKGGESPEYFSLQNWLPALQVAELFEDIDEHHVPGLSWALGLLAPTLSVPLEQGINRSIFFERPLVDPNFPEQRTGFLGQQMSPRLAHLLRTFRPLSEINKFTRGTPGPQATREWATGRMYPYDVEKEMRGAKYRKARKLGLIKSAWKRALLKPDPKEADRLRALYLETKKTRNVN